jgi:lipoprotein-anchoring transpeptidase ErfK/SrfK
VRLDSGRTLPLAWNRSEPKRKYVVDERGRVSPIRDAWATRSPMFLAPRIEPISSGRHRYLATLSRTAGGRAIWVRERDATVVAARQPPLAAKPDRKWIVVSITRRTLVAYEGERAVFATLVSPGAGGVPVPGQNPVKMSTTPTGVYRITHKVRQTTMSPERGDPKKFWLAEVPYTQYFSMPFALHTAYWHEDFGQLMSAGCINVSPRDGHWLFEWTSPTLPIEWNSATSSRELGLGTVLVVVR